MRPSGAYLSDARSMDFLLVAGGLLLLFFGGDFLVRGSVALAHRLGISTLVIALTVVAFGTSSPELIVSVGAALRGVPELAIGNIVGSNLANMGDDVVRLIAASPEALEDFATIATQQDVDLFNQKYSVNLVLPQEA